MSFSKKFLRFFYEKGVGDSSEADSSEDVAMVEENDGERDEEEEENLALAEIAPRTTADVNVKCKMPSDLPFAVPYRGGDYFFVRKCYDVYYVLVEKLLLEGKREVRGRNGRAVEGGIRLFKQGNLTMKDSQLEEQGKSKSKSKSKSERSKHRTAWARAVKSWETQVESLSEPKYITMVENIPQYVSDATDTDKKRKRKNSKKSEESDNSEESEHKESKSGTVGKKTKEGKMGKKRKKRRDDD
ncbi:uncharacterized protein IUM83_08502 [Phytophthora cinnamomi]|uniref:uncharacterized protein n=1 Tax=Phytophthora cinnamomi TaxID=4785 RepID=UPI00355AA45E|nr:hypothetical protein IUM83_08502 [Phytophthora cinnamomi]